MNTPRERFKAALRKSGYTRSEIAECAGVTWRTLENILSGQTSRHARQAITNLCRRTIWTGMPPTERLLIFNSNVEIDFTGTDNPEQSLQEWMNECGAHLLKRDGFKVTPIRPIAIRFDAPTAEGSGAPTDTASAADPHHTGFSDAAATGEAHHTPSKTRPSAKPRR